MSRKKRVLRIGIASQQDVRNRMLAIARGEVKPAPAEPTVWFESMEAAAAVFSKNNMMLIEIIRKHAPESVSALAELSGNQRPNVHRAIVLLEKYAVIELVRGDGGKKAPRLRYDNYELKGSLAAA